MLIKNDKVIYSYFIFLAGNITTNGMFDYESVQKYTVTVVVTDGPVDPTERFATLTIEVTDVNELPVIDIPAVVEVNENAKTQIWYQHTNTDPEGDTVTYSLACNPASCPFTIDAATGKVKLGSTI